MEIREEIPSKLEIIPKFVSNLTKRINALNISENDLFNIKLSLEEALVNAVKYGNKFNPQLFVELVLEANIDSLTIRIKDQGEGFDFRKVLDPTREENIEKISGRGIFLIKSLMDKVEFLDDGSQIIMVKFLKLDFH